MSLNAALFNLCSKRNWLGLLKQINVVTNSEIENFIVLSHCILLFEFAEMKYEIKIC